MPVTYGPVFQGMAPSNGSVDISPSAPLYIEVRGDGVQQSSLGFKINGVDALVLGVFQPGYSGTLFPVQNGFNIYVEHLAPFVAGSHISVLAVATDANEQTTIFKSAFDVALADSITPDVSVQPEGGDFGSAQDVIISTSEPADIYYTIDGSMPTLSSDVYSAPITISSDTTLKFFAVDSSSNQTQVYVHVYRIKAGPAMGTGPTVVAVPVGGNYNNSVFVSLVTNEPSTIYYQIDGSAPISLDNFANRGPSPIEDIRFALPNSWDDNLSDVAKRFRLDFFAVDHDGNRSATQTHFYNISRLESNVVPTNVFVNHPYIRGVLDLSWDDLSQSHPDVIGYNVYRCENLKGKFLRINRDLIESTFYRDRTTDRVVIDEDVSERFKMQTEVHSQLSFIGNEVNSDLWEVIDENQIFHQNDGAVFEDIFGGSKRAVFRSRFKIHGDMDINTSADILDWPVTSSIHVAQCGLVAWARPGTYIEVIRERIESTDKYVSSLFVDDIEVNRTEVATTDMNPRFRIMRAGSDVSLFYWNGSNWTLIESYSSFSDRDLRIGFRMRSSDRPLKVSFNNLSVDSGSLMLPFIKDQDGKYRFQLQNRPVSSRLRAGQISRSIGDVDVKIDGQRAFISEIDAVEGIVTLETEQVYDEITGGWFTPPVPTSDSIVTATYQYSVNKVNQMMVHTPYHYKVTAVFSDGSESRITLCPAETFNSGKLDYMYIEAMRRNSWLLDQAGERVLLFVRKTVGQKARSFEKNERTHAQPKSTDTESWNTPFVGGYEGPFEIRIGPLQTETKINMGERGLKLENSQETWTGMTPIITQRDFVLRRDGSIWAVGPVMTPEIRGIPTQQHFSIAHIDRTDIRYKFVDSLNLFDNQVKIGLRPAHLHPTQDGAISEGEIVEKDRFRTDKGPDHDSLKGRSLTFENQLF